MGQAMSMSDCPKVEFQRRVIVDLLAGERGHEHNVNVLRSVLAEIARGVGRTDGGVPVAEAEDAVRWLAGEGVVEIVREDPLLVARVTDRGAAVAEGNLSIQGVAET